MVCSHWLEGIVARSETVCPYCEIERYKFALRKLMREFTERDVIIGRNEYRITFLPDNGVEVRMVRAITRETSNVELSGN